MLAPSDAMNAAANGQLVRSDEKPSTRKLTAAVLYFVRFRFVNALPCQG